MSFSNLTDVARDAPVRASEDLVHESWTAWAQRLTAAPPTADITGDHARPQVSNGDRHTVRRTLRGDSIAGSEARGLSDAVIAAWALLLARASGEPTVVCADHDGTLDRGVLLEIVTSAHDTFDSVVADVAAQRRGEHAVGPVVYANLAAAVGLSDAGDRNPLCSTAAGPLSAGSVRTPTDASLARPDIDVAWGDDDRSAGAPGITISGSAELFRLARLERLAGQLVRLIESGLATPDCAIADLNWLDADELELLDSWQGATTEPRDTAPGHRSLGHRFSVAASAAGSRVAVVHHDRSWSYSELDDWSNRLAHRLRSMGVGPDDVVAIRMDRCLELVGSILAVVKCGAAYVPVDPEYPPERQHYMCRDANAVATLTTSTTTVLDTGLLETNEPAPVIVVDVLDDSTVLAPAPEPGGPPAPLGDGTQLGYVIYTSGSTGTPKGVALGQRALTNLIDWQLDQPGFARQRTVLQFASVSFDVSFQEIMSTLLSDGTLVMVDDLERRDPVALSRVLARYGVERIFVPFVALRSLAQVATAPDAPALALREVYTAGEQLRVDDTVRAFFSGLPGCSLHNQYGPSETHVVTSHELVGDPADWHTFPPIGKPIANTDVEVLDESGRRLPIGMPGELWIGGRSLASGYIGLPDATAESFVSGKLASGDRLYRSGDRVRWTELGTLEFLGRSDRQVKFRGFRIEPGEITAALTSQPGVADAFVDVRDVDAVGARLVAYIVSSDSPASLADIRTAAAASLPDFMVPTHFVELDALPLTSSGKVDGDALETPDFDRSSLTTQLVRPRNAIEDAIIQMWEALLGTNHIGVLDDFFDVGGDSLIAVELFSMLRDRFHVDLPLGALVSDPTVAALATEVEGANNEAGEFDVLVPIRTAGQRTPLFCIHGGSGNVASFPRLARALGDDQPFYGLQWPGFVSGQYPRSVEALATLYIAAIKRVQAVGPYRLAGQCIGGLVAHEMSRQLLANGEQVDLVVMYDSPMLYSPGYRPSGAAPAIPGPLRPFATRALSAAVGALRFAKGVEPRGQIARVRALGAARRKVPYPDRFAHAAVAMTAIAWRHEPPEVEANAVLIHSGETNAAMLAFTGVWTDETLGWAHRLGPHLRAFQVSGTHNELLYSPDAIELLRDLLTDLD